MSLKVILSLLVNRCKRLRRQRRGNRILFIQTGDYREAFHRIFGGGAENYFGQRFTVNYISQLRLKSADVCVISNSETSYIEWLPNKVISVGMPVWKQAPAAILGVIRLFEPSHIVLRIPLLHILEWGVENKVKLLPIFAQSFITKDADVRMFNFRLSFLLNSPSILWIANHNIAASLTLLGAGVTLHKIIPYEFDRAGNRNPDDFAVKELDISKNTAFRIVFVGSLVEEKGILECIRMVKILKDRGIHVTLTIAGGGSIDRFKCLWEDLGLNGRIEYLGLLPNDDIIPLFRSHDVVVIPSRHDYPEGLPLTVHEALCSRTPIIVSDHPMLASRFSDGDTALIFKASDAEDLSSKVELLLNDPTLYRRLSESASEMWVRISCKAYWSEILDRFISDAHEDRGWWTERSLSSYIRSGS